MPTWYVRDEGERTYKEDNHESAEMPPNVFYQFPDWARVFGDGDKGKGTNLFLAFVCLTNDEETGKNRIFKSFGEYVGNHWPNYKNPVVVDAISAQSMENMWKAILDRVFIKLNLGEERETFGIFPELLAGRDFKHFDVSLVPIFRKQLFIKTGCPFAVLVFVSPRIIRGLATEEKDGYFLPLYSAIIDLSQDHLRPLTEEDYEKIVEIFSNVKPLDSSSHSLQEIDTMLLDLRDLMAKHGKKLVELVDASTEPEKDNITLLLDKVLRFYTPEPDKGKVK